MSIGRTCKHWIAARFPRALLLAGRTAPGSAVALTFDDGPHPDHTPRILEALAVARARATFFVQGGEAERYPALVRDIHAAGHQLANHAWSHRDARRMSRRAFIDEVERTHRLLCRLAGSDVPREIRPPYGSIAVPAFLALTRAGYRFVLWSKDSSDSYIADPQDLVRRIDELDVRAGDIVLFHEDYTQTVAALPEILSRLESRGLRLCTTAEIGASK